MTDTIELTEIECLKLKLSNAEFLLVQERCQRAVGEAVAEKNKVIEEICLSKLPKEHTLGMYTFDLEKGTMTYNAPPMEEQEDKHEPETQE